MRTPYLRIAHLEISTPSAGGKGLNPFGQQFSPEEEEEFGEMARSENFYEKFAASVAPSIYGSIGNSISQDLALAGADMFISVAAQT